MCLSLRLTALKSPTVRQTLARCMSSKINRPSPPPLPKEQQRELELLIRTAQSPLSVSSSSSAEIEVELALHPDARRPLAPDFEGDINPITKEKGGPKKEPVGLWGDWSFKGRVSDF